MLLGDGNLKETIAVICAMESEIKFFKDTIEIKNITKICKRKVYEGEFKNYNIVFTDCGVGKVNASILTQGIIDKYNPKLVINSGIAGGLDKRLKHLDLVIGNKLTYHDFDLRLLKKYSPFVEYFKGDEKLLSKFKSILNEETYYEGLILTGDQFIVDDCAKRKLNEKFDALCVEMEGAAIAHTCFLNDINFLVVRSISDLADGSGDEDYDKFEFQAGKKAAELTLKFIETI
ncbi:MAG: 5'-methylthioadenosine/adenosylhomocysteine nucleosidase [Lagierella massiliensis]|nr:5'-methylthioadenosine/adenosylhomocysteine nucleosidase [Lagierella massiliensis]